MVPFTSLWLMYPLAEARASIGPYGGTIDILVIDPSDPSTLYAGAQGIFKSTDAGEHWSETGFPRRAVISLAVDPNHSSTIYASTSETGVFKSTNGGEDWVA